MVVVCVLLSRVSSSIRLFTAPPPSLPLPSLKAVKQLEKLPPQHYCTGWVQHQVGRAHFETADYSKAKVSECVYCVCAGVD